MAEKQLVSSPLTPASKMPKDDEFEVGKGVCKILDDKGSGTGFLSQFTLKGKDVRGLFTNNHVLGQEYTTPDNNLSAKFTLEFHLYHPLATKKSDATIITIEVDSNSLKDSGIKFTCPILDATFIEFGKEMVGLLERKVAPTGLEVEYLPLIERDEYAKIKSQFLLQVIGHPVEECDGTKHFAIGELLDIRGYNILHKASTTPGSSGSPIIMAGSVIGIHKAAGLGDYNVAVSIVDVYNAIEKSLESKYKRLPHPTWYKTLQKLGFTLRHPHRKGHVYSVSKGKEIWCTHTSHGWHYTLSNPVDIENYCIKKSDPSSNPAEMENYHDHMFDMLAWKPLAESENADEMYKELAAELDKHLKLD